MRKRLWIRIALTSVAMLSLVVAVFMVFFTRSQIQQSKTDILENAMLFARLSAPQLYSDYLTATANGFPQFKDLAASRLQQNTDIVRVMLIGTNGKIIFDSDDFASGNVGRTTGSGDRFIDDEQLLSMVKGSAVSHRTTSKADAPATDIVVPITETGGGHIFSMLYTATYETLAVQQRALIMSAVGFFIPFLLLITLTSILLALSVTRPIKRLTEALGLISSGDYSARVAITSEDELGSLGGGFNTMASNLQDAQAKLGSQLRELTESKEHLEKTVDELRRFNDVTVGRELQMSDLKKQLQDYKERFGDLPS